MHIVTRDFEVELEGIPIMGTVDIDVSGDISAVKTVGIDDLDNVVADIRNYIKDTIHDDPDYDAHILIREEREWQEASDAEREREDKMLREEDC